MGSYRNFKPQTNNQKVPIQLYRWQYGIKITATDFYEGTISLVNNIYSDYPLVMQSNSSGTSIMEYYLEFPTNNSTGWFNNENAGEFADSDHFKQSGNGQISIIYTLSSGESITIWTSDTYSFPFKRMKMHNLEFSLSDAIKNGGISADLMETPTEPMEEVNWDL